VIAEALAKLQSAFAAGQPPLQRRLTLLGIENDLTPLEFQQVVSQISDRDTRAEIAKLRLARLLRNEEPQPFMRRVIGPNVTLFHNPDVVRDDKSLIIAFGGKSLRPMISKGTFLQLLPSRKCDVAILSDPRRNHFVDGVKDYAPDFLQLVRRLDSDLERARYKNTRCFGTSMGGFVALRCGLLLGARAISVGGRFPWRIQRMIAGHGATTDAFELLCSCKASNSAEFICVYGEDFAPDAEALDHLATMFPVTRWPIRGLNQHNAIATLVKKGKLRRFYHDVFAFDQDAIGSRPSALLSHGYA
jgi:hypothetical protein